jgi:hypothetical protein
LEISNRDLPNMKEECHCSTEIFRSFRWTRNMSAVGYEPRSYIYRPVELQASNVGWI